MQGVGEELESPVQHSVDVGQSSGMEKDADNGLNDSDGELYGVCVCVCVCVGV